MTQETDIVRKVVACRQFFRIYAIDRNESNHKFWSTVVTRQTIILQTQLRTVKENHPSIAV